MPLLNRDRFRALRLEADWSTEDLAEKLGMAPGSLRNAESAREPMGDRRIYRAARLFTERLERPVTYHDLLCQDGDGVPDTPPAQPPAPPNPEPQRKEKAGKGPKRVGAQLGAA